MAWNLSRRRSEVPQRRRRPGHPDLRPANLIPAKPVNEIAYRVFEFKSPSQAATQGFLEGIRDVIELDLFAERPIDLVHWRLSEDEKSALFNDWLALRRDLVSATHSIVRRELEEARDTLNRLQGQQEGEQDSLFDADTLRPHSGDRS